MSVSIIRSTGWLVKWSVMASIILVGYHCLQEPVSCTVSSERWESNASSTGNGSVVWSQSPRPMHHMVVERRRESPTTHCCRKPVDSHLLRQLPLFLVAILHQSLLQRLLHFLLPTMTGTALYNSLSCPTKTDRCSSWKTNSCTMSWTAWSMKSVR